jgi:hypothetical protein
LPKVRTQHAPEAAPAPVSNKRLNGESIAPPIFEPCYLSYHFGMISYYLISGGAMPVVLQPAGSCGFIRTRLSRRSDAQHIDQ